MISFNVKSNVASVLKQLDNIRRDQIPFATAVALTKTAEKVRDSMPSIIQRQLDKPTEFTKRGFYMRPARKTNLQAAVGVKDAQNKYLQLNIEGGNRRPGPQGLKLPASIKLDQYGNIPKGIIKQLLAVAKRESGLSKRTSRRIKVSNQVELFYGDPADVGAHKFPPGIYKRVSNGTGNNQLIPIVVFPVTTAKYKSRFKFYDEAKVIVSREFNSQFVVALNRAMASAR